MPNTEHIFISWCCIRVHYFNIFTFNSYFSQKDSYLGKLSETHSAPYPTAHSIVRLAPQLLRAFFADMPLVSPRTNTDHFLFNSPLHQKCRCAGNERCRKGGPACALRAPLRCRNKIDPGAANPLRSANIRRFPVYFSPLPRKNPHTLHNMSGLLRLKSPLRRRRNRHRQKADRARTNRVSAERLCWVGKYS